MSGQRNHDLTNAEIKRYSRQLILPEIGVRGQLKLQSSRVLLIGGGGLGCPLAIYLAAAGIGTLGIVEYDDIELSNLHRQILHAESAVGGSKAGSIVEAVKRLNSKVECEEYRVVLNEENAMDIVAKYDVVADCSDNVATRYLVSDACVLSGKPLVSGSALRWDGQLTVYNYEGGPCYRCLFPTPPPPETVTNCSEGGVLGVISGIIGSMQALEVIKIITNAGETLSRKLFVFDGLSGQTRTVKLRPKNKNCAICGQNPTITKLQNYVEFCGAGPCDKICSRNLLGQQDRISAKLYDKIRKSESRHVLIDVRPKTEFEICGLTNAINIPIEKLAKQDSNTLLNSLAEGSLENGPISEVYVVCRRGNDSQNAVLELRKKLGQILGDDVLIKDVIGGLEAWTSSVDPNFPTY